MASEVKAPLPLKAMCVVYGTVYAIMFIHSVLCFILKSSFSLCESVDFLYGTFPYPLVVQVGAAFSLYTLTGLIVLSGLWRLKRWALNLFVILTASELILIALSVVKAIASGLTTPQPYLAVVDLAFLAYLLLPATRNKFA